MAADPRSPSAAKERADCECDRLGLPPDAECVRDIPCTRVSWPTDSPVAADRLPDPAPVQVACDRCTQGVMDSTNPHLTGECGCECHAPVSAAVPPAEPREEVLAELQDGPKSSRELGCDTGFLRAMAEDGLVEIDKDMFPGEFVPGNPFIARLAGDDAAWEWMCEHYDAPRFERVVA